MTHPSNLPQLQHWSPVVTAKGVFSAVECEMIMVLRGEVSEGGLQYEGLQGANACRGRKRP